MQLIPIIGRCKKILILFAACFSVLISNSQVIPGFLKQEGINGKVKMLTENYNDGRKNVSWYNKKGNETARWIFTSPEALLYRSSASYDEKGNMTEETGFEKGINLITKTEYVYNENGMLIGKTLFDRYMKPAQKFIYQYNADSKMTDSALYDAYNNELEKFSWKYDGNGKRILETKWRAGKPVSTTSIDYTNQGQIANRKTTDPAGNSAIQYAYDNKGRLIRQDELSPGERFYRLYNYDSSGNISMYAEWKREGGIIKKFSYEYDSNGRKITENWHNPADSIYYKYTYEYDDKNNQTKIEGFNAYAVMDLRVTWYYEYDEKGNWTMKNQVINGAAGETITRVFEYYE